ncbi:MAG TPA: ligand-gated channel protein, partial [Polyangiaceae bacterium]|nr:ligand-gated channel protein [Polyangiaceae bacterium]
NSFESVDPIYGDVEKGDAMPYLPPHQVNATLAVEHRYAGANASANYVARMREVAGSGELVDADTTDKQFWLDVGVFARPLRWLTIYGNVRNITAEKNLVARKPYGARVNAPRWVQVGVKAEF